MSFVLQQGLKFLYTYIRVCPLLDRKVGILDNYTILRKHNACHVPKTLSSILAGAFSIPNADLST